MKSGPEKIKLGIIGLGHVFDYQIQAIDQMERFSVCALCDRDREKESKVSGIIPFFNDLDAFLGKNMDAVLISVPVKDHFNVCSLVLKSGKHAILEKPASLSMIEFEGLKKISLETGRLLYILVHAAFSPEVLWFENAFNEGRFKEYGTVDITRSEFYDPYIIENRLRPQAVGLGGSWIDSGINALSVLDRFLDLKTFKLDCSRVVQTDRFNISDVESDTWYGFNFDAGISYISTDWKLKINFKKTTLFFRETNSEIVLDHSLQRIVTKYNGREYLVKEFSKGRHRLVNHYTGVFNDVYNSLINSIDNVDRMEIIHGLYFDAIDRKQVS